MADLWILYGAYYDKNEPNSASRMLDVARKKQMNAELRYIDYFKVDGNDLFYKDEKILSFPKIIFFRGRDEFLIQSFEQHNILVINSSRCTMLCKDKWQTHQVVASLNLNQPKTLLASHLNFEEIEALIGLPFLLKYRYGAQGKNIYLIESKKEYEAIVSTIDLEDYIVQQYIKESSGVDVRVYLIGNQIVGAVKRANENSFLSNVAQGGLSYPYTLKKEEAEMALKIGESLGGHIISVDFLLTESGFQFCEANTNAGFASFIYLGYSIREQMMDYIKTLSEKTS